jgi:D-lyxose ketol-isomerase
MRRSEVNAILARSQAFLDERRFLLPAWSAWSLEDWRRRRAECREVVENGLGWDVTDFGGGDFARRGLVLFTLRNGRPGRDRKPYAEKVMVVGEGQETPMHCHRSKMEDIINRGGGELEIQLWNSTAEEGLADSEVSVSVDGERRSVPAGGQVTLAPGQSICLPARLYHKFWGRQGKGTVLVGEVSRVNDDYVDNRFYEKVGRFASIEEDEPPLHLLYDDYKRYYRLA